MPKRKTTPKIRAWKFEEVPLGLFIEYEERSWTGALSVKRELITGVTRSADEVTIHFGGESVTSEKLLEPKYTLIRDGERFQCGILPLNEHLTGNEKFRLARSFAKMICASWLFIREFEDDRLDPDSWIESAKHHNVLVGNTGRIKIIWDVRTEKEPELTLEDMSRHMAVESAFDYLMNRYALQNKRSGAVTRRAKALDRDLFD